MNIAIFTNNYLPNPYGVSSSIESFRIQLEKMGNTVYVFAPRAKNYIDKNSRVFRYPSIDLKYKISYPLAIPYSGKISKILENLKLDVIHSQHPNLLGTAAMKWARRKKIPLVFTWHTLYDRYTHFVPIIPQKMAINWIIEKAVNYANKSDQIIVPTDSVKGIIEDWGVTNKNIAVVPTGVEREVFENPNGEAIREKYKIEKDEVLLLLVSRLTEEKNVEFLFRTVIEILKKSNKTKFLVAGGGNLLEKLKKMVEGNNLSDRVIFEGIVRREELKNFYAAGDIFVYASKSETQGMILSEAMYSGLPIVAVRATGSQDLVQDGVNGFLTEDREDDFVSKVEKLITDENLKQEFSVQSRKIAEQYFTDEVCTRKLLEVYKETIDKFKISNF